MIGHIAKKENIFIGKDASLEDAIALMLKNGEGMVVFVDNNIALGILTERDLLLILKQKISLSIKASNYYQTDLISIHFERSIDYALHILIDNNIRRLIIKDNKNHFIGILTQEMILNYIERDTYRIHLRVSNILGNNQEIISVSPLESIKNSLKVMREKSIGSILIKEGKSLLGIFTERDLIKVINAKTPMTTAIKEVMSTPVVTIDKSIMIADATELMTQKKIRRLVVIDADLSIVGIIGTRDIMRNIKGNYANLIEEKLKIAKNTLNSLPNMIIEIFDTDNSYHIHWLNNLAKSTFGNVIDEDICTLIDSKLWRSIVVDINKGVYKNDARVTIKNFIYTLSISQYVLKEYKLLRILFVDVTDIETELTEAMDSKEKILEHLMQQSRLAQVGEMISMIAHQWRQPLAAISATIGTLKIQNLLDKYEKDFFDAKLDQIMLYSQHLSDTINDFRDFFKQDKLLEDGDFEQVIKSTTVIIQPSLDHKGIILEFQLEKGIIIHTYINEFKQVILNILQNSYDVLVAREIKNPKITIKSYTKGMDIYLEIGDNGGGISKEIISNIFNPYFTTKDKNGTGLGLYMSRIIIEEHCRGTLSVQNGLLGAIFRIKVRV